MTDHRNFANRAIAIFLAVVAACALALTIMAMGPGISVDQPRMLNPTALNQAVANKVQDTSLHPAKEMVCPLAIELKVNNQFTCTYVDSDLIHREVSVTIVNDQGEIEVGEPV